MPHLYVEEDGLVCAPIPTLIAADAKHKFYFIQQCNLISPMPHDPTTSQAQDSMDSFNIPQSTPPVCDTHPLLLSH